MGSVSDLPRGYGELFSIDLQKDPKLALRVNLLALIITAVLGVPMHFYIPITTLFDMSGGLGGYALRFGVLAVLMVLYLILHELVHGAAMKLCGTKKVRYGFTGMYAFAGSDDYYYKRPYLFIALAPVVLWGAVLAAANCLVPAAWFWVVYLIQLANLSGAAGDLYVTVRFSRLPADVLVRDRGVGMTVYGKAQQTEAAEATS